MTEKEKMIAGQLYFPGDPQLTSEHMQCQSLCQKFNRLDSADEAGRSATLQQIFGKLGEGCWVEQSLHCDYGYNISVGNNFYSNFDCIFLDVCPITIGNNCMIAPRVCFYTATHPLNPYLRTSALECGKPITVGDNVWIGGNAVINPGVTIGNNVVVASGAVVVKDVPDNVVVGGNPARVLKKVPELPEGKPVLETQRLLLREMTPGDLEGLRAILQDEETMYAYEHAFSDDEVDQWLRKQLRRYGQYGFGLWAMIEKATGEFVGQAGLTMQETDGGEVLEVGYLLNKSRWHMGYATEAAKACKDYAFQELKADRVTSIIRDNNLASRRVAERNGMTEDGVLVKHYYNMEMPHIIYAAYRNEI